MANNKEASGICNRAQKYSSSMLASGFLSQLSPKGAYQVRQEPACRQRWASSSHCGHQERRRRRRG